MSDLEALLRGVVDHDQYTSSASVAALLSLGIPTLGQLLAGLEPVDPELNLAITKLLRHLELAGAQGSAHGLRLALLASRDEAVVRDTLAELSAPDDPRTWDALVGLLAGQRSDSTFAFTLHALARHRDPRAAVVLAAHVHDPDPFRRAQAAQALGILGDPRGRDPLRELLDDAAQASTEDRGPSLTVGDVARAALRQLGEDGPLVAAGSLDRPIRVLAWSQLGFGGVGLAGGLALCAGLALSDDEPSRAAAVLGPLFLLLAVFAFAPAFCAGIGLLRRKPWARTLATVAATLELLLFPVGTVLGALGLWILFRGGVRRRLGAVAVAVAAPRPRAPGRVTGILLAMLAVAAGFVVVIGAGFWISGRPLPAEVSGAVVPTLVLLAFGVGAHGARTWSRRSGPR